MGGELPVVGLDPTLILSSDFPATIGSGGAFSYLQAGGDGRARVVRLTASGDPEVFSTLPVATVLGPGGQALKARWIHGLAAGPRGSLDYTDSVGGSTGRTCGSRDPAVIELSKNNLNV